MTNIDVCVATFRRPQRLRVLLESLFRQRLDDPIRFRLIVVDNDADASARETVESMKTTAPVEVIYDVEPVQNIALARNRALSHARGDYVAFIDDDEEPAEDWLQALVSAAEEFDVAVVFGPVLPRLPEDAPAWIENGRFFERKRFRTGTIRPQGVTGNTLVAGPLFDQDGYRFDPDYGLTGGSDTKLFVQIGQAGHRMVWCDEALVWEAVSGQRTNAWWLVRRAFRGGQTHARIFVPGMDWAEKTIWLLKRIAYLSIAIIALLVGWVGGKAMMVSILQKIASNLGQLLGLRHWRYQEYRQ